jgi:hypothetical protein
MDLITVEQLSKKIHKASSSIYSDLIRNPKSLPPIFRITGSRRVLFKDVDLWLQGLDQNSINTLPNVPIEPVHRKRGRPTKSEQLTRARRVDDASPTRGINTQ